MPTYKFEVVAHQVTKRVPCRVCGRKLSRSTTFDQTINPFNKNADGTPKTREQIRVELRERAEKWHPWNDIHGKCIAQEIAAERAARETAEAVTS